MLSKLNRTSPGNNSWNKSRSREREPTIARARTDDFEGAFQIVQGIYPMGGEALKEIGHGMAAAGRAAEAKAMAKRPPTGVQGACLQDWGRKTFLSYSGPVWRTAPAQ